MKSFYSFFSQTFFYGISSVLARVLNFFLVPLYTNIFPADQYGLVTVMYSSIVFIFIISSLGMEATFFRFINKEENKKEVYSTVGWLLIFSSFLLLVLGQLFIFSTENTNQYFPYLTWIFLIVFLDTLCVLPFAKLRQEEKAKKFALIKTINIILNISFNIFFLVICPYLLKHEPLRYEWVNILYNKEVGIGYIFISNLLASGATFLLLLPSIYNLLSWQNFSISLVSKMLRYSSPLILAGLAYATNEVADKIILGFLLDNKEVGIYGACYKLSIFMILFIQAYRYTVEPYYFNNSRKKDFKNNYSKIMTYFVLISLFIFLIVSINKDYIILLLGKQYGYREGVKIIPIILMSHLFLGIYYILALWYKLTDQTKFGAYISIMGAVITIVLNFLLIPRIGYFGSAWATFFCYFSMALVSFILSNKHYFIPYEKMKIVIYFIFSIVIYLAGNFLNMNHWIYNMVIITIYVSFILFLEKLIFKIKPNN